MSSSATFNPDHHDRGSTALPQAGRGRRKLDDRDREALSKDVTSLMYAFGDSPRPNPTSASLVEEMTHDFLLDLAHRAKPSPYDLPISVARVVPSHPGNDATLEAPGRPWVPLASSKASHAYPFRPRLKAEDLRFAMRKDPSGKKLARLEELAYLEKVLDEARKAVSGGPDQYAHLEDAARLGLAAEDRARD